MCLHFSLLGREGGREGKRKEGKREEIVEVYFFYMYARASKIPENESLIALETKPHDVSKNELDTKRHVNEGK